MSNHALQMRYQALTAEDVAAQVCVERLLNCYCRELAHPEGWAGVGAPFGQADWPLALRTALPGGEALQVLLPRRKARILAIVASASSTAAYRYRSASYYKTAGQRWTLLDWHTLASLLLQELALREGAAFNGELLGQIRDSVQVTAKILAALTSQDGARASLDDPYLESEQALHHGHPFHPAPKSRQGFSAADLQRYSPELRAGFALHYFAVRREHLLQKSLLAQSCAELIDAQAPMEAPAGYALLPVHPWEARYLLRQPVVQRALRQASLQDLGPAGPHYYPTSSIRTLYHPRQPFFYKGSLHVRLTNCVRKNALYELDGALTVSRIVGGMRADLALRFPFLRVLEEPAYQTVDLRDPDAAGNLLASEGFALILRHRQFDNDVTPLLSGALFGNHALGAERLWTLVRRYAQAEQLPLAAAAEQWFHAYVERLLAPVLYCYFVYGLVFEPHLQNVLIGVQGHAPARVYLRDFEGVKLLPERYPAARLPGTNERVRQGLWYDAEQGWRRICYCLLVNNFCEAVAQLAGGRPGLEARLWAVVRSALQGYQARFGDSDSAVRINALLAGQSWPAKANLITRCAMRPDRRASYIDLPSPLARDRYS